MLESARPESAGTITHGPVPLPGDALLALHAHDPGRYPFLLESAGETRSLGRYDILFALPGERLLLDADRVASGHLAAASTQAGFLDHLDAWWRADRSEAQPESDHRELPFVGGWFLFLGYELAAEIEPTLRLPMPVAHPIAEAIRIPAAIIRERRSGRGWLVAETQAAAQLSSVIADLNRSAALPACPTGSLLDGPLAEDEPARFLSAVERTLGHVAAGDIYQANLSRAWRGRLAGGASAIDVYRRLRHANPAPFAAMAVLEGRTIASSSPERLVSVRGDAVATRPIAGTRPRGATAELDRALVRELRDHPKERAEHVMLLDLERNDLGRICIAGSVEVDEYMVIETYAHVHHIVSNVRGRLRPGTSPGAVIRATFPGGTITGCPKVRCMDIIGRLEGEARGAYTGSLGYLGRDGSMDLNILIRTIELHGREITFRAGAGIVADSDPQRELEETRAKALGLERALGAGADVP
jgi:anthranilate synthase component 1